MAQRAVTPPNSELSTCFGTAAEVIHPVFGVFAQREHHLGHGPVEVVTVSRYRHARNVDSPRTSLVRHHCSLAQPGVAAAQPCGVDQREAPAGTAPKQCRDTQRGRIEQLFEVGARLGNTVVPAGDWHDVLLPCWLWLAAPVRAAGP